MLFALRSKALSYSSIFQDRERGRERATVSPWYINPPVYNCVKKKWRRGSNWNWSKKYWGMYSTDTMYTTALSWEAGMLAQTRFAIQERARSTPTSV